MEDNRRDAAMEEYLRIVVVRGAGDLATGSIHMLHRAGFRVLALETQRPTAIRRQVSFSEAVYRGTAEVEGVICERIQAPEEAFETWERGRVPLLIDPTGESIKVLRPLAVLDAILAKKNLGTSRSMAPLTIALGPGFCAGEDVDYVVETKRGHRLGRILSRGTAHPNTGIPGDIGGYTTERVIHTPAAGILHGKRGIGDVVKKGEVIAVLETESGDLGIEATIDGFIRGMIGDGFSVCEHFKMADIDPREGELENCFLISDKARCIGGSVLELVCKKFMETGAKGL